MSYLQDIRELSCPMKCILCQCLWGGSDPAFWPALLHGLLEQWSAAACDQTVCKAASLGGPQAEAITAFLASFFQRQLAPETSGAHAIGHGNAVAPISRVQRWLAIGARVLKRLCAVLLRNHGHDGGLRLAVHAGGVGHMVVGESSPRPASARPPAFRASCGCERATTASLAGSAKPRKQGIIGRVFRRKGLGCRIVAASPYRAADTASHAAPL